MISGALSMSEARNETTEGKLSMDARLQQESQANS